MGTKHRRHAAVKGWRAIRPLAACLVLAAAIVACSDSRLEPADTVYRAGYVYTVDDHDRVVSAVAVRHGVIVYTGTDAGAQPFVGPATRVVDLGGRMMMPGLVDAHMHPLAGGRALLQCDLGYQTLTRAQMAVAIQACLDDGRAKEPDAWLEVVNWLRQGTQAVDADPDKSTLDALATQRPVLVRSSDFHTVLTNSRGLAVAAITAATPDPAGGAFDRDASGNPTGICEDAAGWQVSASIPPDTDADRVNQARAALSALRTQGITTFMDAAAGADQGQAFGTLQKSGELTARGFFAVQVSPDDAATDPVKTVADAKAIADAWDQGEPGVLPGLRFRHLKMFGDGVVNAPADTGALLTPYFMNEGTDAAPSWVAGTNLGNLYFAPDVLKRLMVEIAKSGMDPHIHATGERTVRTALDAIEYARQQVRGSDFRPAIAHDETVDPADYARFHDLDVTATFSFQWAQQAPYSVGQTANELGPARFARMEPSGSLANAGARIAFGSDWPIDPFDEMLALKIGVTRSGDPQNPHAFGPDFAGRINADPALTRAAVLRAITMNAAYQLRMENKVGSIEVGKFADLIVLDQNFMQVPEEQLARNQVRLTVVGGNVVFATDPFADLAPASARLHLQNASASTGHAVDPRGGVHGDGHNH